MNRDNDRVITIALSESDWRAFLDVQPQPVAWLKQKIQEQLGQTQSQPVSLGKGTAG